ncbi:Histone-lysine N-methyltransferase set9 [Linnemannia zychae]|nr:Histone-lysine N-methyltransferase set9 [Linnemannia zychae]
MSKDYRSMGIPPGKILDIIQRKVIFERKLPEAVKELLEIEPIKNMFTREKEILDFGTHAKRYLSIYLPSAGFEISQTDRYSAVTNKSEACVIANRPFEVGDELRYCAGTIANLTEQEEKDLETKTSDFSVIKTSRRGTCLFLGPARFVNHDCDPNCSFMSAGSSAIYFKVQKPISVNDEITTHYGDNYFGVDNQECLCATCDRLGQGGYKDKKLVAQEEPDEDTTEPEQEDAGRRLRNRRGKPGNSSTPLADYESDMLPRGVASSASDSMERQTDTPFPNSRATSTSSGQLASPAFSDQSMEIVHGQNSTLAIEATNPALQTPSPTIDMLPLDDSSLHVEGACPRSISSLKNVALSTDNVSTADMSPAFDGAFETDGSSVINNSPLSDIPPVINSTSDNMSLTCALPVVENSEAIQPTQPRLETLETSSTNSVNVGIGSSHGGNTNIVDMMTSLQLTEAVEAKLEAGDGQPRVSEQRDTVDFEEEDPAFSDQFDGDLSDAGIDEDTNIMSSPRNRMSLDFLLSPTAAHALSEQGGHLVSKNTYRSDTADEGSRQASVQLSEGGDEAGKVLNKRTSRRAKPPADIPDPEHCATCKTYIPQHERNETNDCRRCYRHFAIYEIAWPSRSRNAIVERYKKAAQEERDREKKRKLAAEAKAKQEKAKEEARARQEQAKLERAKQEQAKKQAKALEKAQLELQKQHAQQKIDMRKGMGLPAVEKTKVDRYKQRRMKLSATPGAPYDGYSYQVGRSIQPFQYEGMASSMAHPDMTCMNGQMVYPQMAHPHSTYQGMTNNLPGPYQQDYCYPVQHGYPFGGTILPMTPSHPFHEAPYIVFVDPMDTNPEELWWPAVTVPLNQWDPTMPDYSTEPDYVLVRFLEDCTYANCSISGLKLFHRDREPYKSYVRRGREFTKNPAVKRALALLDEGIPPPRFRWRNMSWDHQKSLEEVSREIQRCAIRMQETQMCTELRRLQNVLNQSTHTLQLMRNDPSTSPLYIQSQEQLLQLQQQDYQVQMERLQLELQNIGGPPIDFNLTAAPLMGRSAPAYMNDNGMDVLHLDAQQKQPQPATKAKRPRKPKHPNQPNDSQQSMESTLQKLPLEPKEPVEPSNSKPKRARGPSRRKIQMDLQLMEHTLLLEAACMGSHSFRAADGTVFSLASASHTQESDDLSNPALSEKKRALSKSRAPGSDCHDQLMSGPSVGSTDQLICSNSTATTTVTSKARRRRADKQTVDIAYLDTPVVLSTMMLPRSISLEPSSHQLIVIDPLSRFSSLPALVKTKDCGSSLSSTWDIHEHAYSETVRRVIEGHYNCVEITLHNDRAGFAQRLQDGDMFLDCNDLSEASTPASSDSTETDVSLPHGETLESIKTWTQPIRTRKGGRKGLGEDENGFTGDVTDSDAFADGEGNENADSRSTTDTFDTGELSSAMPSSSSSSMGEGDREVDVEGYETQDVDIGGLTDQELAQCLLDLTASASSKPALRQETPSMEASTVSVLQRLPPMVIWNPVVTPRHGGANVLETPGSTNTPKRAPKKSPTKKSSQPPVTPDAITSSSLRPPAESVAFDSDTDQDTISEVSQVRSRRGKKQPGKSRKASSPKSKVVVRGIKRQNSGTVMDGALEGNHVNVDNKRASNDKDESVAEKEWITEHSEEHKAQKKASAIRRQRRKKRGSNETPTPADGRDTATTEVLDLPPMTTSSLPHLLKAGGYTATPSASSPSSSSRPETESPEPASSLSEVEVSDSREIHFLKQWSIKGGLVGFDIDSNVRSVRSRSKKSESFTENPDKSLPAPKATKSKPASKARVIDGVVNEPKRKPRKRRKMTNEYDVTQSSAETGFTVSDTTKSKHVGDEITSTVRGSPEERKAEAGTKGSTDAQLPASKTVKGKEASEESAPPVDVGLSGKDLVPKPVNAQVDAPTMTVTSNAKETRDDPKMPVNNTIDQSRIVAGKVVVSRKASDVVVVRFFMSPKADPSKSDVHEGSSKPKSRQVIAEAREISSKSSETEPSSPSEVSRKRGSRRASVEMPDDSALQRPVAMSTRKRARQSTDDKGLMFEEELIGTKSFSLKSRSRTEAVNATAAGAKVVKRRRVQWSVKSKQDEILPTQEDEVPSDKEKAQPTQDETTEAEGDSPSSNGEVPLGEEVKALSEKDDTPADSGEESDSSVGRPMRRQSIRLFRVATPTKNTKSSARPKVTHKKQQVKIEDGKSDGPLSFAASFFITTGNITEGGRLRNRDKEPKQPNTSTPKFAVGDEVLAPGEDNLMFDAVIKEIRDHKTLQEVYEYRVHYDGYASKYDAWVEEKLLEGA